MLEEGRGEGCGWEVWGRGKTEGRETDKSQVGTDNRVSKQQTNKQDRNSDTGGKTNAEMPTKICHILNRYAMGFFPPNEKS